jgi:hypothetical protein
MGPNGGGQNTDDPYLEIGQGRVSLYGGLVVGKIITPTINADINNYDPTDLLTASIINANVTGATRTITGIEADNIGVQGRTLWIASQGAGNDLVLAHNSGSSDSTNRFRCPGAAAFTIRTGGGVQVVYMEESGTLRWHVMAP